VVPGGVTWANARVGKATNKASKVNRKIKRS